MPVFKYKYNGEWIPLSGTNKDNNIQIEVDSTLTQAGMAADAKAVGEAISNKQNIITGTAGQFVVIGDNGEITTQTALQSDWNQNNESTSDYIKNRTHWSEPEYETIVPLQTTTGQHPIIELGSSPYGNDFDFPEDAVFVIDGISYEVSNWFDDFGENYEKLYGDSRLGEWIEGASINQNSHPEDVPFCATFTWYDEDIGGNGALWGDSIYQLHLDFPEDREYTVEVKKRVGTVYHKLDVNYLPIDDIYNSIIVKPDLGGDGKVTQNAAIETDGEYPIILGKNTSTSTVTDSVNKTSTLKYNPATQVLTAPTFKGGLNTNGKEIILTADSGYGQTFPSVGTEGQLFFLMEEPEEEAGPSLPIGGSAGQILVKNSSTDGDASWQTASYLPLSGGDVSGTITATKFSGALEGTATNATNIYSSASTAKAYILGTTTASNANHATVYNASVYTSGNVLYGAAWNDYAEYRICNENFIPGQVVCENGDDTLSITTERLQPGANIVSDTFGFAIGETDEAKCPIAVSGRVLAYTYEPKEEFKAGDAVCAGPNGTVSKMTREEIREYPERIIGTVSAIPNYETWGTGNVKINNRIWIKI